MTESSVAFKAWELQSSLCKMVWVLRVFNLGFRAVPGRERAREGCSGKMLAGFAGAGRQTTEWHSIVNCGPQTKRVMYDIILGSYR